MAKIFFVRHGESMGNVWAAAYQNDNFNFLSPTGLTQAKYCGQLFKDNNIKFDKVVTTPYLRARQTTMTILQELDDWKRGIISVEGLKEKGMRESIESLHERVKRSLHDHVLNNLKDTDTVLVVTHYHTMQAIIDTLGVNRATMTLHGGMTIPNAVPFLYKTTNPTKFEIFDYFKTNTVQY